MRKATLATENNCPIIPPVQIMTLTAKPQRRPILSASHPKKKATEELPDAGNNIEGAEPVCGDDKLTLECVTV